MKVLTESGWNSPDTVQVIPSGINLNSYDTTGEYVQNVNANAKVDLNYPLTTAGHLSVISAASFVYQYYTSYNITYGSGGNRFFYRSRYNSVWGPWIESNSLFAKNVTTATSLQLEVNRAQSGDGVLDLRCNPNEINVGTTTINITAPLHVIGGSFKYTGKNKVFNVTSGNVVFDGVTISGPGAGSAFYQTNTPGINVEGTSTGRISNVEIKNCTFKSMHDGGIRLAYVDNFEVHNNSVDTFTYGGIMAYSVREGSIHNNSIKHGVTSTAVAPLCYGIAVTDSDNTISNRSRNVKVSDNYIEDIKTWEGLDTHGGKNISFIGNTIKDCRYAIVCTVGNADRVTAPEDFVVIGNQIDSAGITETLSTGVSVGGSPAGAPKILTAWGNITGNSIMNTTTPIVAVGNNVDRSKSSISGNSYNNTDKIIVSNIEDTDWVSLQSYGTFQSGYASNSIYPTQIRIIRDVVSRRTEVFLRGAVSVTKGSASNSTWFRFNSSMGVNPSSEVVSGYGQSITGSPFTVTVDSDGYVKNRFPNLLPPDNNFTVSSNWIL